MLEVLLWKKIDPEIRYACSEVLNHIGLPYSEVDHFETSRLGKDAMRYVVILPESSQMDSKDIETLRKSSFSVIFVGHVPHELADFLSCSIVGEGGKNPPKIAGSLKVIGIDVVPFFYEFPILKLHGAAFRKLGEIKDEDESRTGIVLGEKNGVQFAIIAPQLFRSTAYLLAGSEAILPEEYSRPTDRFGRMNAQQTEVHKEGFLRIPIVNIYEKTLLSILVEFSNKRGKILIHKWFYPKDHDMALCLAHDVEGIVRPELVLEALVRLKDGRIRAGFAAGFLGLFALASMIACKLHISKSKNSAGLLPLSFTYGLMSHNPLWNFEKYIKVEREFKAKSAFYFLNNSSREDSDYSLTNPLIAQAIRCIRQNGFEVGLHASFNSFLDEVKTRREKLLIEQVSGEQVSGVTQHFMRLSIPETWRHQKSAGLMYDASFGFPDAVGFRAGICLPFFPWDFETQSTISILEIPLVVMDGTLFQRAYMHLSAEKAFEICKKMLHTVYEYNGVCGLQWHNSVDSERDASWFSLYREVLSYCSKLNAWCVNGRQMAEWWNLRASVAFKSVSESSSSVKFEIISPRAVKDFSMRMYTPWDYENIRISINNQALGTKNCMKKGNLLLFSIDLLGKRNEVEVRFSSGIRAVRTDRG